MISRTSGSLAKTAGGLGRTGYLEDVPNEDEQPLQNNYNIEQEEVQFKVT